MNFFYLKRIFIIAGLVFYAGFGCPLPCLMIMLLSVLPHRVCSSPSDPPTLTSDPNLHAHERRGFDQSESGQYFRQMIDRKGKLAQQARRVGSLINVYDALIPINSPSKNPILPRVIPIPENERLSPCRPSM